MDWLWLISFPLIVFVANMMIGSNIKQVLAAKLVGSLFVLICSVWLLYCGWQGYYWLSKGQLVEGKVAGFEEDVFKIPTGTRPYDGEFSATFYKAIVLFEDSNGNVSRFVDVIKKTKVYKIGDVVDVVYFPDKEYSSKIVSFGFYAERFVLFVLGGVLILGLFLVKKRRR